MRKVQKITLLLGAGFVLLMSANLYAQDSYEVEITSGTMNLRLYDRKTGAMVPSGVQMTSGSSFVVRQEYVESQRNGRIDFEDIKSSKYKDGRKTKRAKFYLIQHKGKKYYAALNLLEADRIGYKIKSRPLVEVSTGRSTNPDPEPAADTEAVPGCASGDCVAPSTAPIEAIPEYSGGGLYSDNPAIQKLLNNLPKRYRSSKPQCWRGVREALEQAGLGKNLHTRDKCAKSAGGPMSKQGFVNLLDHCPSNVTNNYSATFNGAVRVYDSKGGHWCGHVEVQTPKGFCSTTKTTYNTKNRYGCGNLPANVSKNRKGQLVNRRSRPLTGLYVKAALWPKANGKYVCGP